MQPRTTFRRLIEYMADLLGGHHVPVRRDAREIREFLLPDAIHDDLLKRLVSRLYRANRCAHLDAAIDCEATLDALGEMRLELLRSPRTDIDQYGFIEDFCAGAGAFFADADDNPKTSDTPRRAGAPQAEIIHLPRGSLKVS
jgi:hypothetical protein